MQHDSDVFETALRAANRAVSGSRHREVARIASIELRAPDPRSSAWEAAAMASVGVLALLVVFGIWFF